MWTAANTFCNSSEATYTVLAAGIAALHVRIMRVSPPYCAHFTRKLRARYTRVKKYTKL